MDLIMHTRLMLDSFRHWTGRDLIPRSGDPARDQHNLFESKIVVVAHGTQPDPILNYGNRAALRLWETTWDDLTRMPSRLTAEPMHRDERAQFMERVKTAGFLSGYRGVRISSSGRRFTIENAVIWNIRDEDGSVIGQAAAFGEWKDLPKLIA